MAQKILVNTDKNGTKYYHCKDTCMKCGGKGVIPQFYYNEAGECFECNGSGIVEWNEKEYTPEYQEKLRLQAEKRAERKLAKAREKAGELNAEFYARNGFNAEGITYFVLGNTYDIKEELKAQGAKWDNGSKHWHMAVKPAGREVVEINVNEMYYADAAGVYDWRNWKSFTDDDIYTKKIESAEQNLRCKDSVSQHVGTIGEKLTTEVTYVHTASWENGYGGYWNTGVTNLHTFKDAQGNVFIWKTDKFIEANYGTLMVITGTIKEHSDYKGTKQTVLTRCKLQEARAYAN